MRFATVRYGTVRYGTVRYHTVRYGTIRHGTVRYGTDVPYQYLLRYRYGTVWYLVRYRTVLYSTLNPKTLLVRYENYQYNSVRADNWRNGTSKQKRRISSCRLDQVPCKYVPVSLLSEPRSSDAMCCKSSRKKHNNNWITLKTPFLTWTWNLLYTLAS